MGLIVVILLAAELLAAELIAVELVFVKLLAVEMAVVELLAVELLAAVSLGLIGIAEMLPDAAELESTGTATRRSTRYGGTADGARCLRRSRIVACSSSFVSVVYSLSRLCC